MFQNELPRMLEEYVWRTHEALKAMMYGQMYTEYPHSFRPKDRLEILLDLRRNNRQVSCPKHLLYGYGIIVSSKG